MNNNDFNYLKGKCKLIEELSDRLRSISSKQNGDDYTLQSDAYEEFVTEFHYSYDFTEHGVELLNSDSKDMTWTIEDFVESGCKDWKEFSVYLADKLISIYKKYLNQYREIDINGMTTHLEDALGFVEDVLIHYYDDDPEVNQELFDAIRDEVFENLNQIIINKADEVFDRLHTCREYNDRHGY